MIVDCRGTFSQVHMPGNGRPVYHLLLFENDSIGHLHISDFIYAHVLANFLNPIGISVHCMHMMRQSQYKVKYLTISIVSYRSANDPLLTLLLVYYLRDRWNGGSPIV